VTTHSADASDWTASMSKGQHRTQDSASNAGCWPLRAKPIERFDGPSRSVNFIGELMRMVTRRRAIQQNNSI